MNRPSVELTALLDIGAVFGIPQASDEVLFLRAGLLSGTACLDAWRQWSESAAPDRRRLSERGSGTARLLALLGENLKRNDATVPDEYRSVLRVAAFRDELRWRSFESHTASLLAALRDSGSTVMLSRGVWLAACYYPEPHWRHCHDLDLMVPSHEMAAAISACARAGFVPDTSFRATRERTVLRHGSGMFAVLHARPFRLPFYGLDIWNDAARGDEVEIRQVPVRTLRPEYGLVHVLGHACCAATDRLQWASDSWMLIENHRDLDWGLVINLAVEGRLELPLHRMLTFLSREVDARVPRNVLTTLGAHASLPSGAALDAMVAGALLGGRGRELRPDGHRGIRSRVSVARHTLLPSPAYLKAANQGRPAPLLPLSYAENAARVVGTVVKGVGPASLRWR